MSLKDELVSATDACAGEWERSIRRHAHRLRAQRLDPATDLQLIEALAWLQQVNPQAFARRSDWQRGYEGG